MPINEPVPQVAPFRDTTLLHMLHSRATAWPDKLCLKQKCDDGWESMTWREYFTAISRLGSAFEKLGVGPGDMVAVLSETRREWMMVEFAVQMCRGIVVGLYTTSTTEQMRYMLEHAEARFLIVENRLLLEKIAPELPGLTRLARVVAIEPAGCNNLLAGCLSLPEMLAAPLPDVECDALWQRALARVDDPEIPVACIYTSGTTGPPKGAMLCHRNFLVGAAILRDAVRVRFDDRLLSILPMAHALQRIMDYATFSGGGTVVYAESIRTLVRDVQECRPTILAGVPRILEKMFAAIRDKAEAGGRVKKTVFYWSLRIAREFAAYRLAKKPLPFTFKLRYRLATKLVFSKVARALGGQVRLVGSGGAAIAIDLEKFYTACGLPIIQAWGMTETSVAGSLNLPEEYKYGSAGKPSGDTQLKIAADGEILLKGSVLFLGYFKRTPAEMAAEFDADGWYKTGDVGSFDDEGYLFITDRKKEIIVTAAGKNISPQNIENVLNRSPLIAFSYVHGDKQKYLTALLAPEMEKVREKLAENGVAGGPALSPDDPAVHRLLEPELARLNQDLARHEQIRRFALAAADFTIDTDELTPTMKLKRRNILARYGQRIKELYGIDWQE